MTRTIRIVAGPTASGKSALAIRMAQECGGAIVNCDSRQIYAALPILSAQPTAADRAAAPHLLYGCIDPNESVSAGSWRRLAMAEITRLLDDEVAPIVTGGNGLYIKALIEGLSPIPPVPPDIRAAAIARQSELGNPAFHQELARRDPETAALYHPMHTARLVHAWEVLEATGTPLARWQAMSKDAPPGDWRFDVLLVQPDRAALYARCDARFEQMLADGATEEAQAFDRDVAAGVISPQAVVTRTIGLSPLRDWREGRIGRDEAIRRAQMETRHYAKRQMTWFRNQLAPSARVAIRHAAP